MTLSNVRSATTRFSSRILLAELLQLAGFARQHATVDFLPAVERLLGDPHLAAQVTDRRAGSACFNTVVICSTEKRFFFTALPPGPTGPIVPQNSLSR